MRLIQSFDERFCVFVLIDRTSKVGESVLSELRQLPNVVHVEGGLQTSWGGYTYLLAVLDLCRTALSSSTASYFHLISGQDYPTMTGSGMSEFLDRHEGQEFIACTRLPADGWTGNGGLDRSDYFHLHDYLNLTQWTGAKWARRFVDMQRWLHLRRGYRPNFPLRHGGSDFWTLSRCAIEYILDYGEKHPEVLRRFRFTEIPAESYPHSVLMNSPFRDRIAQNNLRFIDWQHRNGSKPAYLDATDYEKIMASGAFFARKLHPTISADLIEKLNESVCLKRHLILCLKHGS